MKTFVTGILGGGRSPRAWLAAALVVCGAAEARAQGNFGTIKGRLVWGGMKQRKWGRIINVLNTYAKAPAGKSAPTSVSRAAGMALERILRARRG